MNAAAWTLPCASRTGKPVTVAANVVPSRRRPRSASSSNASPAAIPRMSSVCRRCRPSLTNMSLPGLPIASSSVQPNVRAAAGFQETIVPSSPRPMIASREESTTAASQRCCSCALRCSVMSRAIAAIPVISPSSSWIGPIVFARTNRRPAPSSRAAS